MAKELHRAPESLSVWESNMKELRRLQPKLAVVLEDYVARHGHEFAHTENVTPAGRWIEGLSSKPFFQSDGEPKFEWNHKTKESSIFFLYGIGTAPYLFKAIRALPKDALSLVVIEPNLGLLAYTLHLTHVYLAMPPGGRLSFLVLPEMMPTLMEKPEEERDLTFSRMTAELRDEALVCGVTAFGVFTISLSKVSIHEGEESAFREEFADIAAEVKEWAVLRLNGLGNSAEDTMLGLRQMALMSPWIVYGYKANSLAGYFKGRPFIVVSAGPSLEKNFELLRDVQDKAVIVATDAVLGKMLKSGILPHIVCALERGFPTYNLLFAENVEKYPEECSKILLITQAVCTPKIFGRWPGPKTIVGKQELPLDQWFLGAIVGGVMLPSGSSVAHMNYSLGAMLGASSIALIGQDLALGEGGKTHAGNIFEEQEEDKLKKNVAQGTVYKIPGALGGYVDTTEVWLMFLRTLESFVRGHNVPTWDCTEGGALIAGTKVEPFAKYIEENIAPLDPFEKTPAQVILETGAVVDRQARLDLIKGNFGKALDGLAEAEKIIDEITALMERVASAGLEPQRRVVFAQKTGHLLDELHEKNPMFAFVTQSYVYLASMELAQTRSLASVEMVERWVAFHQEILEAHRSVLAFIKGWLSYSSNALQYYVEHDPVLSPPEPGVAERMFLEIYGAAGDNESPLRFRLDALLSICDPVRLAWPGNMLWTLGMALLEEGRSEEATVFMEKAAADFDGKEMPVSEMASFFKDYARVLSTNDLCHIPPYHLAETMLSNAIELEGGMDDEIRAIMESVLDGEIASYENIMASGGRAGIGVTKWFKMRAAGERALLGGDLPKALRLVWKAIKEHGSAVPGWAASHLDWLAKTLEQCFVVTEGELRDVVNEILDDMATRGDILAQLPLNYTREFVDQLNRHGLNVELQGNSHDENTEEGEAVVVSPAAESAE